MKKAFSYGLFICFAFLFSSFTNLGPGYKVGDTAEGFRLKNVDGKMVSPDDYKEAKGFIVIFSCNHCPYVKAYEQRMIDLDKKFSPLGYPVIAINPNDAVAYPADSYENMVKRSKEMGFTFPYLQDETQEVARKYGALKTPHVYLLNKEKGALKVVYTGAIDDNTEDAALVKEKYVENAIQELLKGKPVSVKETKAIGCSVKYKK